MEERSRPKVMLVKNVTVEPYELFEFSVEGAARRGDRQVDVLLMHGLTGHSIKTWGGSLDGNAVVSDCWPRELAIELQCKATFWTLGYPAPAFDAQLGTTQTAIEEEGRAVLAELIRAGLGDRPIILVTHSLGGLLAKAILAESVKADRLSAERQIFDHTHAVIFAGTPHAGSAHARWRFLVPLVVGWATKAMGAVVAAVAAIFIAGTTLTVSLLGRTWQTTLAAFVGSLVVLILGLWLKSRSAQGRHVLMLDPDNPGLRRLVQEFRRARSIRTFFTASFYEQKRLWGLFLVVPWWSADPGVTDCEPVGIAATHTGMCKLPHARGLQRSVRERVDAACRGKTASVFGEKLQRLIREDRVRTAFDVLFSGKPGDRGQAEQTFRTFLREKINRAEFVPERGELDLALESPFDEDLLVWNLRHEQTVAGELRHLRRKAEAEARSHYRRVRAAGSKDAQPTLIPFYRALRMMEHICAGDLNDPGSANQIDRHLLLELIEEATKSLEEWRSKVKDAEGKEAFDADGRTRRLLLRMSCMLRAIDATQEYVGFGDMKKRGADLAAAFAQRQTAFDRALTGFRSELNLPPVIEESGNSRTH